MERTITFSFWGSNGEEEVEITEESICDLEDYALSEISEKIKDGYVAGELLYVDDENIFYNGFWEYKKA